MNATIQFTCPQCSHEMRLPASVAGKKGKCPKCAQVIIITAPVLQAPFSPAQAPPLSISPDPVPAVQADPFPQQPVVEQPVAQQPFPPEKGPQPKSTDRNVQVTARSNKKAFLLGATVGAGFAAVITVAIFMLFVKNKDDAVEITKNKTPAVKTPEAATTTEPAASAVSPQPAPESSTLPVQDPLGKSPTATHAVSMKQFGEKVWKAIQLRDADKFMEYFVAQSDIQWLQDELMKLTDDPVAIGNINGLAASIGGSDLRPYIEKIEKLGDEGSLMVTMFETSYPDPESQRVVKEVAALLE